MNLRIQVFLSIFLAVALATPILLLTVESPSGEPPAADTFSNKVAESAATQEAARLSTTQVNETRQLDPAIESSKDVSAVTSPPPDPAQPLFLFAASLAVGLAAFGLVKRLQP